MVYTSHYLSGNLVDTLFCQSRCMCVVCPFIHQREEKKNKINTHKISFSLAPKIVISYKL